MIRILLTVTALVTSIMVTAQVDDATVLTQNPFPRVNRQPCMMAESDDEADARTMFRTGLKQSDAILYAHGSPEIVVVLANFGDLEFQDPKISCPNADFSDVKDMFNSFFNGSDFANNPNRRPHFNRYSVAEYFAMESKGQFTPHFTILDPVKLSNPKSYYTNRGEFRDSALVAAAPQIKDRVADFDKNNGKSDGYVDAVIIVFPGQGANTSSTASLKGYLHPCQWPGAVEKGGVKYATELIAPELQENDGKLVMNGIGVFCHEMSHMLGLPDMYDTGYKGAGMDYWDLMDYGEYCNGGYTPTNYTAYDKYYMGWIELEELAEPAVITGMKAVADGGKAYVVRNDGCPSEYYILENRTYEGDPMYYALGSFFGEGLMIYHIDENASAWSSNKVNTVVDRQRITIVPANGHFEILDNLNRTPLRYYSELIGHLYPLKSSFESAIYGSDYIMAIDALEYWGVEGNNALTDDERTDGTRIAPAATVYHVNTDGSKLMHKAITNIVQHEDKTISFDFMSSDTGVEMIESQMALPTGTHKYIIDGKIVVVKGGKAYSLTGQQQH